MVRKHRFDLLSNRPMGHNGKIFDAGAHGSRHANEEVDVVSASGDVHIECFFGDPSHYFAVFSGVMTANAPITAEAPETPQAQLPDLPTDVEPNTVPPLAKWAGLDLYDPAEDKWVALEKDGIPKWWRPQDGGHPVDVADALWEAEMIDEGQYRARYAHTDRRKKFWSKPFVVPAPEDEQEIEELQEATYPNEGQPTETPTVRNDIPRTRAVAMPQKSAASYARARASDLAPMPVTHTIESPLVRELGYLLDRAEAQRAREHQTMLSMMDLMVRTVDARAAASIASEQARCDATIEFLRTTNETKKRNELAPLQRQLEELQHQVAQTQDDAAADQEEIANQLVQWQQQAQQPEGAAAVAQAIGGFFQSDAGRMVAEMVKKALFSGDEQPQPQQEQWLDPAGG